MSPLVAIKVRIGLRPNGHADHPNWALLPFISNDDEAKAHMPFGWVYDKKSGHQEEDAESPYGVQFGCLLVTRIFADAAKAQFPSLITELTEAEFETFWDERAMAHLPDDKLDHDELESLKAELALRKEMGHSAAAVERVRTKIQIALDRNDPALGVRKYHMKKWADAKIRLGATIDPSSGT